MGQTKTERFGKELFDKLPPGSVRFSYLLIRITDPNGNRLFIDRSHRKGNLWRIRTTNHLAAIQQRGTHHTKEEATRAAARFARDGTTP